MHLLVIASIMSMMGLASAGNWTRSPGVNCYEDHGKQYCALPRTFSSYVWLDKG